MNTKNAKNTWGKDLKNHKKNIKMYKKNKLKKNKKKKKKRRYHHIAKYSLTTLRTRSL